MEQPSTTVLHKNKSEFQNCNNQKRRPNSTGLIEYCHKTPANTMDNRLDCWLILVEISIADEQTP